MVLEAAQMDDVMDKVIESRNARLINNKESLKLAKNSKLSNVKN